MRPAVYLRVSSPQGQKTDSQRAELEAWLKRHHYKAVQWFEDRESATTMQRDALQRLQAAIFAGTITTVVVWKLDRLAHSLKEGVNVLADWYQRGVRIIAITQQIDLSGPVGHLIASLLFGIAEISPVHWVESAYILLHMSPPGRAPGVQRMGDKQRALHQGLADKANRHILQKLTHIGGGQRYKAELRQALTGT